VNLSMSEPISNARVRENYLWVADRIAQAASRSGRSKDEIRLIGVTKYVDATVARFLVEAGCCDLGESRPQVIWEKSAALADLNIRWHLIGHLQRNKIKKTLPQVSYLHSLDSERLLQQIEQDLAGESHPLEMLLEINVSGDSTKTGLTPAEGEKLLDKWVSRSDNVPNLRIAGLMGMGSLAGGEDQARSDFESLRKLRDVWAVRFGLPLRELSMGMSEDFEIAIEQGATMIRIGSILFASSTP
jgi:pyridoxal phosphate enzyme (YggS family)